MSEVRSPRSDVFKGRARLCPTPYCILGILTCGDDREALCLWFKVQCSRFMVRSSMFDVLYISAIHKEVQYLKFAIC